MIGREEVTEVERAGIREEAESEWGEGGGCHRKGSRKRETHTHNTHTFLLNKVQK